MVLSTDFKVRVADELRRLADEMTQVWPDYEGYGPSQRYWEQYASDDLPTAARLRRMVGGVLGTWADVIELSGLRAPTRRIGALWAYERRQRERFGEIVAEPIADLHMAMVDEVELLFPRLRFIKRKRAVRQWCIHTHQYVVVGEQVVYQFK